MCWTVFQRMGRGALANAGIWSLVTDANGTNRAAKATILVSTSSQYERHEAIIEMSNDEVISQLFKFENGFRISCYKAPNSFCTSHPLASPQSSV